jgi:hypothetical protein
MEGKLVRAASSYARAASSAVSYVPSQTLVFLHQQTQRGSCLAPSFARAHVVTEKAATPYSEQGGDVYRSGWRISETQAPQCLCLTPLNLCSFGMATVCLSAHCPTAPADRYSELSSAAGKQDMKSLRW